MARLYTDENFPRQAVERLRELGHDVETARDAGHSDIAMSDMQVLEHAIRSDRAVVTLNRRHFVGLHERRPEHCGIVVCTFDPDFRGQSERIHATLTERTHLRGALIRVNRM